MHHKRFNSFFDQVYIEQDSLNTEIAQRALKFFPKEKIKIITDQELNIFKKKLSSDDINSSKKKLLLKKHKGQFFKRCPGAKPGLVCCNYFVLNLGQHCEMDCSYCYLQTFINFPFVTIYTNIDNALKELDSIKEDFHDQKIKVGTGELTDSLSLDDLSLYSQKLISYFQQTPNWTLEFKTKTQEVQNLINTQSQNLKNIIVSWSLNPEFIVKNEEHKTASLKERLKAAKKCQKKGFSISFHIDPIIYHKNWKENYSKLVTEITKNFSANDINSISLGALRFQPEQKSIMRERFTSQSLLLSGDFFKSKDGKMRYDQSLRADMFQFIKKKFLENSSNWKIFLCMEQAETWLKSFEQLPQKDPNLQSLFHLKTVHKYSKIKSKSKEYS